MKTKFGLFQAFKSIVLNERGEIGPQGDDDSIEDSGDEIVEESGEEEQSEESEDSEEVEASEDGEVEEVEAETEEEFEQEVQEAIKEGASEEVVKSMIRKFNLKVDGKDVEKEIDLNDEEALKREFQLAAKGQKSMQEKAEQEKAFAQFLQAARKDPLAAIKQLDPEFDDMEYLSGLVDQMIKENEMSPEEKEQQRIRQEYEQAIAERDSLKKEAQERQMQEQTQKLVSELKSEIESVLTQDEDLVPNQKTIALVAQEMQRADAQGVDLNASQALQLAKNRLQKQYEDYPNIFKSTASMKKYVGDSLLQKLREDRAQLAKKQQEVKSTKGINSVSRGKQEAEAPQKKFSLSDLMAGRVDLSKE